MLRFNCKDDFLEIDLASEEAADVPSRGDAYLTIRVSSAGFAGHNDLWVSADSLRAFCAGLIAHECSRRGEASIEAYSPGELKLKVRSVNSRGHMAVEGITGYEVQRENVLYWHAVHFGFEFDPSQLKTATSVEWIRANSSRY
jgi:stage V sporulation protein SpoVS